MGILFSIYDEKANALTEENYKAYLLKCIGVGGGDEEKTDGGQAKKKKKKKAKLSAVQQEQLQFAAYLVKEIMPNRKRDTFNQSLPYDEYAFLLHNQKLLFHGIPIDLDKVTFYKESDPEAPEYLKIKPVGPAKVGHPA